MIESEYRVSEPVLTPARKRVLAALGAAVLVHGLILLVFAGLAPLLPNPRSYVTDKDKRITMSLERPQQRAEPEAEDPKKNLDYLETNPNQESSKPPEDPAFQSDKDTLAASENPEDNKGAKPLPSQEGRDLPAFHFDTKPYTPGEKPANLTARPAASSSVQTTPPPAAPPPEFQTTPPRPQPNLTAPPPPTVGPRDIATLPPTTPPPATPAPDRSALLRPPQPDSRMSIPSISSPGREQTPGYQPQTEKTKMVGGLSNRGESSAAALGTPLGRYQKAISDAIGNRWYFYANRRIDLSTIGTVRVSFYVNKAGKAENVRIVSNSSNETVASYSIQSIIEAKIPAMPPEVAGILTSERMPVDYSFAIY